MATDHAEILKPVAIIGSPNTTNSFTVDILEAHATSPLEGKIFHFDVLEGRINKIVLTQLMGLKGINRWHEDPTFKAVIKRTGKLEHLSGSSDIKTAQMQILGVFETIKTDKTTQYKPVVLHTPPPSGTEVREVSPELMNSLFPPDAGLIRLGYIYGSAVNTPVPFFLKHFGEVSSGGFGEAPHFGVFGQSGMGKSIFAAQMIAGLATNKELGILIIDPQGEFTSDGFGRHTDKPFSFHELLKAADRHFMPVNIAEVTLESHFSFVQLLRRYRIFKELGFKGADKQDEIVDSLITFLKEKYKKPVKDINFTTFQKDIIPYIATSANHIYARTGTKDQKHDEVIERVSSSPMLQSMFEKAHKYFEVDPKKRSLSDIIADVVRNKDIAMLDLSKFEGGDEDAKLFIINDILNSLKHKMYQAYGVDEKMVNTLVVLDEAHNFAPQAPSGSLSTEKERTRNHLIKAAKETRKYGIGWFYITQSISDFHKEIYRQLNVRVFAWGLSIGADADNMISVVGKEAFEQYSKLPNPKQSQIYSFLVTGQVVALGTTGKPIIVRSFPTHNEMIDNNKHLFKKS